MSDSVYKGDDFDQKVRKQVEFYFSDSNLQTDKFLWKIYQANDGWVELKTILTFGRMKQFRPEEKVIAALKESPKLVLSANEDMIRRKDPLMDFNELKVIRKRNTVHIEGFPIETTQEELELYFAKVAESLPKEKSVGSVRRIKSRQKREFFGVVDVELVTSEDAEFLLNNLELVYPDGIVTDKEAVDNKTFLKKMSLLTFQEMRESGKRFGVNDVTKRRLSFNDTRNGKKPKKNFKSRDGNGDHIDDKKGENEGESSGVLEATDASEVDSKSKEGETAESEESKVSEKIEAEVSEKSEAKESEKSEAKESDQSESKESDKKSE